ncbi:biotin/lipoyl-containing protein [Epibacterium sp. Ofav1-8]|uniref:biotin/lipoyl-containing protein n=1 Tax=Epibacterium sp. Ofav1-8 TaxID=2917735 RepID=UPI001EF46156|nr:biotin/lipoyl-containing protein [Epibacterium sp. Ofav1-8]MCG7625313.1 pyruvate dehydrogenase [Epibacterium sp. Ofav1-8]
MPHEVIMPALGMAQDSGLIVAWHKAPGDEVAAGDVLFEVETDKATMEVEAQANGVLSQVRHEAGADVPVGEVIAMIGTSAEATAPAPSDGDAASTPSPDAAAQAQEIPDGHGVIMPALGMAQDSGLIVAWHKGPGDEVASGDVLFEVETDKSTVEVEADTNGFVAALLAEAGEEAPVGEVIAVISKEKPNAPVQLSRSALGDAPAPAAVAQPAEPEAKAAPTATEAPTSAPAQPEPATDGRILASPKARRLALEQGLDFARLAEAGHPQPYHVADLETLRTLPTKAPEPAAASARRLTADLASEGFSEFAAWARDSAGLSDAAALLAGFAGASLGRAAIVAVETLSAQRLYQVPRGPLGDVTEADPDSPPDLCLRDLRLSRISGVDLGPEDCPTLTLCADGFGLVVTLECAAHSLTAREAVALLSNFAARMEQPVRHLL